MRVLHATLIVITCYLSLGCTQASEDPSPTIAATSALTPTPAPSQQHLCPRDHSMPTGFRMSRYRGPTPHCAPYSTTLDTKALQALLKKSPDLTLIDVSGIQRDPEMDFGGIWFPSEKRNHIQGSVWLPNVGRGELSALIERYFQYNLQQLTQGQPDKELVFYCIADCWMSWNAAIRAASYGYQQVYWYKNGTDGWSEQGLPLVRATPLPVILPAEATIP